MKIAFVESDCKSAGLVDSVAKNFQAIGYDVDVLVINPSDNESAFEFVASNYDLIISGSFSDYKIFMKTAAPLIYYKIGGEGGWKADFYNNNKVTEICFYLIYLQNYH